MTSLEYCELIFPLKALIRYLYCPAFSEIISEIVFGSVVLTIENDVKPVLVFIALSIMNPSSLFELSLQVSVTVPFDPTRPGYVWHCHIIDHEDNEMMRRLKIK